MAHRANAQGSVVAAIVRARGLTIAPRYDAVSGLEHPMTLTATQPHKIYLAGRWVDSPDRLEIANPADAANPAGATYNATEEQYDEAVTAAVAAFEETRALPAYERGR